MTYCGKLCTIWEYYHAKSIYLVKISISNLHIDVPASVLCFSKKGASFQKHIQIFLFSSLAKTNHVICHSILRASQFRRRVFRVRVRGGFLSFMILGRLNEGGFISVVAWHRYSSPSVLSQRDCATVSFFLAHRKPTPSPQ